MSWELRNLIVEVKIIKENIEDALTTFCWFDEEYFMHEPNHVLNRNEVMMHGMKYHEKRRYITQHIDLLSMYLQKLDTTLEDVEKCASENFDERSDNA